MGISAFLPPPPLFAPATQAMPTFTYFIFKDFRSKKTPYLILKLYTLFMTQEPLLIQDPENHTLFSGTYPSRPNPGVPPPPGGGAVRELACRLQVQEILSP